jgi:hypothetical protein
MKNTIAYPRICRNSSRATVDLSSVSSHRHAVTLLVASILWPLGREGRNKGRRVIHRVVQWEVIKEWLRPLGTPAILPASSRRAGSDANVSPVTIATLKTVGLAPFPGERVGDPGHRAFFALGLLLEVFGFLKQPYGVTIRMVRD